MREPTEPTAGLPIRQTKEEAGHARTVLEDISERGKLILGDHMESPYELALLLLVAYANGKSTTGRDAFEAGMKALREDGRLR